MSEKWVQVWGQAHAALSHFYYPSCKKTYRMVVCSAISGSRIRIELCNNPAKTPVEIGGITVAKCDKNGTFIGGLYKTVTVNSKEAFVIGENQMVITDPVDFEIGVDEYFCISIYVVKGKLCSGNLLNNVNLITVKGDYTRIPHAENQARPRDTVRKVAAVVLGMGFHKPIPLINTVELLNNENASSIVMFGDSITQQGFWTNAFEKRIREQYKGRYAVINRSIMGNRTLHDFHRRFPCPGLFGISGLNRYEKDVLRFKDAEYVVFVLGTNDFLQYGTIAAPKSEKPTPEEMLNAVKGLSDKAHECGKKFIAMNVLHFGLAADARPEKDAMVLQYNKLLDENKDYFDMVYDQASRCIDKNKPNCSRRELLGPDKIHPNSEGGQIVADNFDLNIFKA